MRAVPSVAVVSLALVLVLALLAEAKPRAEQHKLGSRQHDAMASRSLHQDHGSRHHERLQSHHQSAAKSKSNDKAGHHMQDDFMRDEHLLHVIPPLNAAEKRLHAERTADRHLKDVVQRTVIRKSLKKGDGKQKNKKAVVNKKLNSAKKRKLNKKLRDFNAKSALTKEAKNKTKAAKSTKDFKGKKAWKKAARKALRMQRENEENKQPSNGKKTGALKEKLKKKLRTKREKKIRKQAKKN